jgi:hypothetical protein
VKPALLLAFLTGEGSRLVVVIGSDANTLHEHASFGSRVRASVPEVLLLTYGVEITPGQLGAVLSACPGERGVRSVDASSVRSVAER